MNTIVVKMETKYGNQLIYPVCQQAKLLTQLTGQKTLTRAQVEIIKQLGFTVAVEQLPASL